MKCASPPRLFISLAALDFDVTNVFGFIVVAATAAEVAAAEVVVAAATAIGASVDARQGHCKL